MYVNVLHYYLLLTPRRRHFSSIAEDAGTFHDELLRGAVWIIFNFNIFNLDRTFLG